MLKIINKEELSKKLKAHKKGVITSTCVAVTSIALGAAILSSGCGKENENVNPNPSYTQETEANDKVEISGVEVETPSEEVVVEEVKITELNVEEFDKLVSSVEEANIEAGLNLRKENLELVVYINNIDIATPELVEKIESSYNYNEEDMLNVYLKTMTAYNNDRNDFYNGVDTKYADMSLMFTDKIDKETIKYIDALFEELHMNVSEDSKINLTLYKFNKMVEDVMSKNKELGIDIPKEYIEYTIYWLNLNYRTEEVDTYIETVPSVSHNFAARADEVIDLYKEFNKKSEIKFDLSSLEFESVEIGEVVDELYSYTRENGKINGYAKDQLTVGGLFAAKLQIDDAFAYFATTGYANGYEEDINAIQEADFEAIIARTYAVLGSKAALVECDAKELVK